MSSADKFISIFNTLEDWLKTKYNQGTHDTFYHLIEAASDKNRAVHRHQRFLKRMGDLRNAIFHDREFPQKIIADPREDIVAEFETVLNKIMEPIKLLTKASHELDVFTPQTKLTQILQLMREMDYSQVIVQNLDDSFSLITREGISMWVEANIDEDVVSIKETLLEDVLPYEKEQCWVFVPRQINIYDGIAKLSNHAHRIQALIITENGLSHQKPLGLFTIWEMKEILKYA